MLSPHFSSSSGSLGARSFVSSQSVEGSVDYDNAITNAAQQILIANPGQVLELLIEREINRRRANRRSKDEVFRTCPVAKKLFRHIVVLTKHYTFRDETWRWTPGPLLSAECMLLMLGHADRAVNRVTTLHAQE